MKKVLALIAAASILPILFAVTGGAGTQAVPPDIPETRLYGEYLLSRGMAHPDIAKYTKDEYVSDYIYDMYQQKIESAPQEADALSWRLKLEQERESIKNLRELAAMPRETLANKTTDELIETALLYLPYPPSFVVSDPRLALSGLTDIGLIAELFARADAEDRLTAAYAATRRETDDSFRTDRLKLLLERLKTADKEAEALWQKE